MSGGCSFLVGVGTEELENYALGRVTQTHAGLRADIAVAVSTLIAIHLGEKGVHLRMSLAVPLHKAVCHLFWWGGYIPHELWDAGVMVIVQMGNDDACNTLNSLVAKIIPRLERPR